MWLRGVEKYFPAAVRNRALEYRQRIRVLEQSPVVLHAHLRGAIDYCVRIELYDRTVGVWCTCPYFDGTGPCKHVWALLEYADRTRAFGDADPPRALTEQRMQHLHDGPVTREPLWRQALSSLRVEESPASTDEVEIVYILDVAASRTGHGAYVDLGQRTRVKDGTWSKVRALLPSTAPTDAADRELVPILTAIANARYESSSRALLESGSATLLLTKMAKTGRLYLRLDDKALEPCAWDDGDAWSLQLVVLPNAAGTELVVQGELRRRAEARPLRDRLLILADGLVIFPGLAAPLSLTTTAFRWVALLLGRDGQLRVPIEDGAALALELKSLPEMPLVELPQALRLEERSATMTPSVRVISQATSERLAVELRFAYDDVLVDDDDPRRVIAMGDATVVVRDRAKERAAGERLRELGVRQLASSRTLAAKRLGALAAALGAEGWRVEADGKRFRSPGAVSVHVTSGIDWFDLAGEVDYDGVRASLPALLAAARRGETFVKLGDGSLGLLPEAWLARHRLVGELGTVHGAMVRFGKNQVGVLDALLTTLPEATGDRALAKARGVLAKFDGLHALDAPDGFIGALRAYQRDGLGWLAFLRDFGFGGCLADDMGLGKTIQVLVLLQSRERTSPSLVVVPRSLVFNWLREAARFTPRLRVREHHGVSRTQSVAELGACDLIVTTYGTMVRDIALLRRLKLDYVILDEAQAVKNARTEAAKAVRLLPGRHRLALTGTPIENRLADLWSLFEFLNPGMLGASSAFKRLGEDESTDAHALLARALRPFILRRTKEQVATDLPAKTEQIIYCELEGKERERYDELRAHYRDTLLGLVDDKGIERVQLHILEALLRLRQAACHPGLIDRAQATAPSAKLAALLAQLDEVRAGGHKALVFSQFTSLLGIVRKHLDVANVTYEYLDGRTRDRQARVDRFQTDPACSTFLVSLKAGGVGLNLTAAEYVFLLDPWWNPAVEAQAIDRTHRIGQSRPVIAYRLIGRDTIEEKVLALQAKKRHLADALVGADNALLGRIGRDELELLLS